ncbi:MAG: hypothetical protein ACRD2L_10380, partial [Terriglobia bacterium]
SKPSASSRHNHRFRPVIVTVPAGDLVTRLIKGVLLKRRPPTGRAQPPFMETPAPTHRTTQLSCLCPDEWRGERGLAAAS